ncbi:MAG: hypothetical protein IJ793_01250, partial [Opitutales bacterium]|nr:hypothetical protein [Opitutales bacterium]
HEAVLSSMKSLSATRYVKVGDTHGKSGFSALGQILSNIGHNIKVLFAGNGSADRANLEKSVSALAEFAKNGNKADLPDKQGLEQLYQAVKSTKYEHIKENSGNRQFFCLAKEMDGVRNNVTEALFNYLKREILNKEQGNNVLLKSINNKEFNLDTYVHGRGGDLKEKFGEDFTKMYENYCFIRKTSFEDLALRTFSAVPGDKETLWAAYKNYVKLTNLVEEGGNARNAFMNSMNSRFYDEKLEKEMMKFKNKPLELKNGELKFENEDLSPVSDPKPKTLADRIEVSLKMIAKNSGINLN